MIQLKNSGYSQKFREEIIDSSMKAFQCMIEDDTNGIKPLYRIREWQQKERQQLKLSKKYNWWNSEKNVIQYKSVMFVTPTPGGVLVKELTQREAEVNKNSDERIKFEEKGGMKIKNILNVPKNLCNTKFEIYHF